MSTPTPPRHGNGETPMPWPVNPGSASRPPKRGGAPGLLAGILLGVVVLALVAVGLNTMGDNDKSTDTADLVKMTTPVTVHISLDGGDILGGGTSADVTLGVGDETNQFTVDVPMTKKAGGEGLDIEAAPGTRIYFSAQMNEDGAEIECSLTASGVQFAHGSSSVDYGIVTCSGTVPSP